MRYWKLIGKEFKFRIPLAAITFVVFILLFHFNGYTVGSMEYIYVLFALASCAVLFTDDEADLLMLGQIQLANVFLFRFVASLLSVALLPSIWIILFTKERHMWKAFLAFAVLVLFFAAVGAFWRVVLNSTFASLFFSMFTFALFMVTTFLEEISPFRSLQIAGNKAFLVNRISYMLVSLILIVISYLLLRVRNRAITRISTHHPNEKKSI